MSVIVSGLPWMGQGIGSIETAIEEVLESATNEVIILTYSLTLSAKPFLSAVSKCLARGVKVTMVVNRLHEQDPAARQFLSALMTVSPRFQLFDFSDNGGRELHAKVIVVDRCQAIVGSANLSWGGQVANLEMAIKTDDQADVFWIAEAVDRLFRSSDCLRRVLPERPT